MKILRVIATMAPSSGGPAQGIRNSVPPLNALGCENEVVSLDDPAEDFVTQSPFPIHALGKSRGPWGYHPQLIPWLTENAARFDVVLVHGLWLFPSYAVWKVLGSSKKQTPYFVFPHGMLDPWFQKAAGRRLKAARNWLYWKAIEHKVIRDAAAMLFTCEQELLLARQTLKPYRPRQEINVGYGISTPPLHSAEIDDAFTKRCPEIQNKTYLLFLSRIHEKKGVDLLIRAYAALRNASATTALPDLVIAGPGLDTPYGRDMQDLASQLCPPSSVHFPGMLTGDAKWGAFYGSAAFVLPSHQENFGIAVVEALACGKPVLISDQVNIWREIVNAKAGLVESDDEAGTTRLLAEWQKGLSQEPSEAIRSRTTACFRTHFHTDSAASRLLENLSRHL